MHRTTAALLASIVLLPALAVAQDRGSEAEQEACTPDVFRLCSDFIPNEGPILTCLQSKHAQLSSACEPVIFPHKAVSDSTPVPLTPHRRRKLRHKRAVAQ